MSNSCEPSREEKTKCPHCPVWFLLLTFISRKTSLWVSIVPVCRGPFMQSGQSGQIECCFGIKSFALFTWGVTEEVLLVENYGFLIPLWIPVVMVCRTWFVRYKRDIVNHCNKVIHFLSLLWPLLVFLSDWWGDCHLQACSVPKSH